MTSINGEELIRMAVGFTHIFDTGFRYGFYMDAIMGSRYNFNDIITVSGYQSMVPLTDYSFYKPLCALTTRIGESGVFVNEKIDCYVTYLERS